MIDSSLVMQARKPKSDPSMQRRLRRAKRAPLSHSEFNSLRSKIEPITCSAAWADQAAIEADLQGVKPSRSARDVQDSIEKFGIYPPAAEHSRMALCHTCGRDYPRYYTVGTNGSTICRDCLDPKKVEHARPSYREMPQRKIDLSKRDIEIFSLWIEGFSEIDIGEILGISDTTIHYRITLARRRYPTIKRQMPVRYIPFEQLTNQDSYFDSLPSQEHDETQDIEFDTGVDDALPVDPGVCIAD